MFVKLKNYVSPALKDLQKQDKNLPCQEVDLV